MTKIQTVAKTHLGKVRDHNEDTFIVGLDPTSDAWVLKFDEFEIGAKGSVFIVADGMGGENAGEIASEIAVQSIKAFIHAELQKEENPPILKILESSLIYAHNCIKDACRDNPDYIGMGTTATVCMIKDNKLLISWVGDSRVYRYSKNGRVHQLPYHFKNLEILSEDHSKVWLMMKQGQIDLEQARTHDQSNIITQSLGDLFRTPQPDSREYPLFRDDHILICSDGLNGMLSDKIIEKMFSSHSSTLDNLADQLISEANIAGGHDNITLILSKVTDGMPYDEEMVSKGSGDKTVFTVATRKGKTWVVKLLVFIIAIGLISIVKFKSKNIWVPILNHYDNNEPTKIDSSEQNTNSGITLKEDTTIHSIQTTKPNPIKPNPSPNEKEDPIIIVPQSSHAENKTANKKDSSNIANNKTKANISDTIKINKEVVDSLTKDNDLKGAKLMNPDVSKQIIKDTTKIK